MGIGRACGALADAGLIPAPPMGFRPTVVLAAMLCRHPAKLGATGGGGVANLSPSPISRDRASQRRAKFVISQNPDLPQLAGASHHRVACHFYRLALEAKGPKLKETEVWRVLAGVRFRYWCTRLSLVTMSVAALAIPLALMQPFSLITDGHGGYSNSRNFFAVMAALCASALACLFSVFANQWRGRLILGSIALVLLSYLALFTGGH